jgi:hypothetical protein
MHDGFLILRREHHMKLISATVFFLSAMGLESVGLAQPQILDVDPAILGPRERQTWVKISNPVGNNKVTLRIFRVEEQKPVQVDAGDRPAVKGQTRIDFPVAVKKTWWQSPPKEGDYTFQIQVFDQMNRVGDKKDLVVKVADGTYAAYYDDPIRYIESVREPFGDAVLVKGEVVDIDQATKTIKFKSYGGKETKPFVFSYKGLQEPEKLPVKTKIEAAVTKAGKDLVIRDFAVEPIMKWAGQ